MVLKVPKANFPALHKRLVVDTVNGKVRVRKWPEKRGKNVPQQVRIQNERFAAAQRLAKTAKGVIMNRFVDATKGTGLYPRDLFTKMALAPPIELETPDGRVIRYGRATLETVVFQGIILRRTTDFTVPGGTSPNVIWPLPILDTSNFFSAAQPDRITIPAGVAVVNIFGGTTMNVTASEDQLIRICEAADNTVIFANQGGWRCRWLACSTGPIVVSEGDQFAFIANATNTHSYNGPRTYFGLEVLGAEV